MHALFTVSLVCSWLILSGPNMAQAQVAVRTQPIILNESACCTSPARIPVTVPSREYRGMSSLTPSMAESMPTVVYAPVASPAGPFAPIESPLIESPRIDSRLIESPPIVPSGPVVEYRFYAPVSNYAAAQPALGPNTNTAVPQNYVVGRNVIGDPKLFRPGQPVRNFLRYLSL